MHRQFGQIDIQYKLTLHTLGGGVDQQSCIGQCVVALFPGVSMHRRSELAGQCIRLVTAAVEQANVLHTRVCQSPNHSTGCTTGTQDHRSPSCSLPMGLRFEQTL